MAPQSHDDNDGQTEINATVSVQKVLHALDMNATDGVDDLVIAIPQRDGVTADTRPAFTGSERYSNPSNAPVHITPESLVDDGWTRPPRRHQVDYKAIGVPEAVADRDAEDEQRIDEAYEVIWNDWRDDIHGMILDDHEFEAKDCNITLTGEVSDE
jgi:hypothetical protein